MKAHASLISALITTLLTGSAAHAVKLKFKQPGELVGQLSGIYAPKGKKGREQTSRHIALMVTHNEGRQDSSLEFFLHPLDATEHWEAARYKGRAEELKALGDGSGVIVTRLSDLVECDACFVFSTTKQGAPKMRITLNMRDKPGTTIGHTRMLYNFTKILDREFVRVGDLPRETERSGTTGQSEGQ